MNVSELYRMIIDSKSEEGDENVMLESISRYMADLVDALNGNKSQSPAVIKRLKLFIENNVCVMLLSNLDKLNPEKRKLTGQICSALFRSEHTKDLYVAYIIEHWEIVEEFIRKCEEPLSWSDSGVYLREFIRDERITQKMLQDTKMFSQLCNTIHTDRFDVAANAFDVLKLLIQKHPKVSATFLTNNFSEVVALFDTLLRSKTYITKMQSLSLLASILLERANFSFMIQYIHEHKSLEIMLELFLDMNKQGIKESAFSVLKIFVANPKKTKEVSELLSSYYEELREEIDLYNPPNGGEKFQREKKKFIAKLELLNPENNTNTITTSTPSSGEITSSSVALSNNEADIKSQSKPPSKQQQEPKPRKTGPGASFSNAHPLVFSTR